MSTEGTVIEEARVGDTLRQVREARGLSLADINAKTLISTSYLQAMEDMYLPGLPKGYLNGFLRTYATYLNLPAEDVIKKFSEQCGAVSQAPKIELKDAPVSEPLSNKVRGALYAAAAALILVLSGSAFMFFTDSATSTDTAIVEAGTAVNGARQSLLARADRDELATQLPLRLTAVKSGWLEVRGADGTIFRSRDMAAGESYFPRIGAGWTVTVRDGSAFIWNVGDLEIGPIGESSAAVYALSVDDIAAAAQDAAAPALAAFGDSKPTR